MASVLDRPMFKHNTAARDRLSDIAGIQRFQQGGPVEDPVQKKRILEAGQLGGTIRSTLGQAADDTLGYLSGSGNVLYGAAADVLSPAFATLGATSLAAGLERNSDIAYNAALANIQNGYSATSGMTAEDFDLEPADFDFAVARAKADARNAPSTPRTSLATPGDRQRPLPRTKEDLSKATAAAPTSTDMEADARGQSVRTFVGGKPMTAADLPAFKGRLENQAGPSGMEAEARKLPQGPQGAPVAPTGQTTMEADARGRKPLITSPAEVAAGLNDPKPEVREKTAADFAKQFADMSPKYKGTDKGLMLAQIGFAIAAGDSPNAMSNIANGLSAGADMMIKDKAARDEFDRQIQLTSMQYGLGEASKMDAEKRLMEREGRNGNFFVADRAVELGGRKYAAGESVFLPNEVLWDKGVPAGLVTESMADTVAENKAAYEVALEKAKADKAISVGDFTKLSTELNNAADSLESTRALRPLLEASIIRAADGKVTGVSASFTDWTNRAANAAGVDLGKQYEDPAQFQKDMLNVSNQLIQEILRETGRNISVSDRQIVADMVGQINNDYDRITADPNVLLGSLQNVLKVIDKNEQAAIDQYTTVTRNTAGLLSPSGGELTLSDRASRVFEDTAPVDMEEIFSYDEASGVWKLKAK